MKTKKIKLLSSIGLNEQAPIWSVLIVTIFLMGLGMVGDLIAGDDRQWIGFLFLIGSFLIYKYVNKKSRNLSFEPKKLGSNKKYLIAIIPSNVGLLDVILQPHKNLQRVYFIYDDNSNKSVVEKISNDNLFSKKGFLKAGDIRNPENIISIFDDILEDLKNDDFNPKDVVVDITTGLTISSLILYKLAELNNIDVSCNISQYDENNKIIEGTTKPHKIDFDVHFKE